MSSVGHNRVNDIWYGRSPLAWLLLPLSLLFGLVAAIRRFLYGRRWLKVEVIDVPVIVVGNIAVGGTGKTPVTGWLAGALTRRGFRPVVISRGYGGDVGPVPLEVGPDSDPLEAGDEAVLLAHRCDCPVVVHPDRVAAARKAMDLGADVIVSDDGLQHYRLGRRFEIVVVDGSRGFGNGYLLPAGPLREPQSRLHQADVVAIHQSSGGGHERLTLPAGLEPLRFCLRVNAVTHIDSGRSAHIGDFRGKTVHAVAGIGHPERFFGMLESEGIKVIRHPLADHAPITVADIRFGDGLDVLMTEKDAVKCRGLGSSTGWYVSVDVDFAGGDADRLLAAIDHRLGRAAGGG